MWIEVEYYVEDLETLKQNEKAALDNDAGFFNKGVFNTKTGIGIMQDSTDTVCLLISGNPIYLKYDKEVIEKIMGKTDVKFIME